MEPQVEDKAVHHLYEIEKRLANGEGTLHPSAGADMSTAYKPKLDDNPTWAEQYRLAGEDWADKEAAASLLEDTKSAVMAQMQTELGDMPVNRAEQTVKASDEWFDYVKRTVEARRLANIAKVNLEATKMAFTEWNSREANARQEMKML